MGLLDDRGERRERWVATGCRAVAAEGHLVEDALSETAEPSMEGGEVRLPGADIRPGDGGTVPRMPEVPFGIFLDDRDGERLPGEEIGGENPAA
ncbi:MAG: hypothetical protein MUE73_20950 [Planctomycetes bacterium]|jgi:hypothetical protein|nr:hypothetical protein [Planctomycetota bacterium]